MELSPLNFDELIELDEEQLNALIGHAEKEELISLLVKTFHILKSDEEKINILQNMNNLLKQKNEELVKITQIVLNRKWWEF